MNEVNMKYRVANISYGLWYRCGYFHGLVVNLQVNFTVKICRYIYLTKVSSVVVLCQHMYSQVTWILTKSNCTSLLSHEHGIGNTYTYIPVIITVTYPPLKIELYIPIFTHKSLCSGLRTYLYL